MDLIKFIEKKKSGSSHKADEITEFISLLTAGNVPDYQAAAWLMAVNFNGLDPDETVALTMAIVDSGEKASYDGFPGPVVDKHSTGGVGDKVTLILLPILAEMGMYVPKHSGRALGFTGGTIDKLESIPGFNAFIPEDRFREVVRDVGFAIGGQSKAMCPADGILYALRDATSTVNETGLIAASIISKKVAGGAEHIVIDVKVGRGAFMPDEASARELADMLVYVGTKLGRNVRCILTRMDQPLGRSVGNSLELYETVEALRGDGSKDVMDICKAAASGLASMSGKHSEKSAIEEFDRAISSGNALKRFASFVSAQDGAVDWIDSEFRLPEANSIVNVKYSGPDAYVDSIDAMTIGEAVRRMGGGRLRKDDVIDHSVGVVLRVRIGDPVCDGAIIAELHLNDKSVGDEWTGKILSAYTFMDNTPILKDVVIGKVPG